MNIGSSPMNPTLPATIQLPKVGRRCSVSGLSRSALNALILPCSANGYKPAVKSIVVKQKHATRGIRLIVVESLLAYLKSLETEQAPEVSRADC